MPLEEIGLLQLLEKINVNAAATIDRFAYEVQFDTSDSASTPTTLGVYIGDSAEEPLDPTRAGFAFEGWYTHPTGGDLWDFSTIVATDLTLYAQWSALPGAPGSEGLAATGPDAGLVLAIGTALAGALMVVLLSSAVMSRLAENPVLPLELQQQVNLDSINFVNNEQLATIIANTDATAEQKAEAMRINSEARLSALKIGLLLMSGLALLTVIPAGRLPRYRPGEIPPP